MTVQEVFDIAIHMMDEQNESTGATITADTQEYVFRTPSLLNGLVEQVYRASDTYMPMENGLRSVYGTMITSMEDSLDLDDFICKAVLPYGLAGLLLLEENPTLSNFFWQTYLENFSTAMRTKPPEEETSVTDVYGGNLEYGQFAHW